ncbi:MAG: hypothetical protein ACFFCZ_29305 [Promethearchaeota archaeon]
MVNYSPTIDTSLKRSCQRGEKTGTGQYFGTNRKSPLSVLLAVVNNPNNVNDTTRE